jgi:hypothetical protein
MSKILEKYAKELTIDLNALDTESIEQPARFMEYALLAIDAEDERDRTKRKREVVYAEVEERIRAIAAANGEKTTEAAIKAKVTMDEDIEAVEMEYLVSIKRAKVLNAAVSAFEQRKKSLEQVCNLYGLGYFSQPRSTGVTNAKSDYAKSKLQSKMKR